MVYHESHLICQYCINTRKLNPLPVMRNMPGLQGQGIWWLSNLPPNPNVLKSAFGISYLER